MWVPSAFNRDAFVEAGVSAGGVHVLPHGLEFPKYNLSVPALQAPFAQRAFRILFNGGLLPRKGIDALLIAYLKAGFLCILRHLPRDAYITYIPARIGVAKPAAKGDAAHRLPQGGRFWHP